MDEGSMANDQRSTTTGRPSRNPKNLTAETRVVRKNWNCALIITSFIAIHETHFIGRRLRPPVEKKFPPPRIWASGRDLVPLMRPRRSKLPLSPLCCPPRSEERRVGKECRSRSLSYQYNIK